MKILVLLGTMLLLFSATALAQDAYLVGPGDVLDVQVWDNKDLSQVVFVAPDGKISLPLTGQIRAAGLTIDELQDQLGSRYSKTVKAPSVSVILKEIRSRPLHLVSGFAKTGILQLTQPTRILEIIPLSGGILPTADGE